MPQLGARAQLVHAAIQVGIAGGPLRDAGNYVRDKAHPSFEAVCAGWAGSASTDPHIIRRYGQLVPRWLGWRVSRVRVTVASRCHKCPASFTART